MLATAEQLDAVIAIAKGVTKITWQEAVHLAGEILERAERELAEEAEREAAVGIQYEN